MAATEGAGDGRGGTSQAARESLQAVLQDPRGFAALRQYLQGEPQQLSMLLFWAACELHRRCRSLTELVGSADYIHSDFLGPDAKSRLKLSWATTWRLQCQGPVAEPNVFVRAQKEAFYQVLRQFKDFTRHSAFVDWAANPDAHRVPSAVTAGEFAIEPPSPGPNSAANLTEVVALGREPAGGRGGVASKSSTESHSGIMGRFRTRRKKPAKDLASVSPVSRCGLPWVANELLMTRCRRCPSTCSHLLPRVCSVTLLWALFC